MQVYQDILFNERLLKEFSVLPLQYNTDEVKNFCKLAEVTWLLEIIGEEWYQELLDQVKDNNLTPENATALVEAIYPYLGFAVSYEALPSMWLHVSEISVTKGKSENSEPATQKEMVYYEQWLRRQLEARKDYLISWLCQRRDYYPLLPDKTCDCGCGCSTSSCGCDNHYGKLNNPNPMKLLYSTLKKDTDIR